MEFVELGFIRVTSGTHSLQRRNYLRETDIELHKHNLKNCP